MNIHHHEVLPEPVREEGSGRLRRLPALILLAAAHLMAAFPLVIWAEWEAARRVQLGGNPLALLLITGGLLLALALSAGRLTTRPRQVVDGLGRRLGRTGPLPELLFTGALLALLLLLLVNVSLTPLLEDPLFAASVYGLPAVVGFLMPTLLTGERRGRFAGNVGGLLLGLLLAALAAEAGLRLLVRGSLYHPDLDLRPGIHLESRSDIPGISPICVLTTNSLGLRGEEPPEDWVEAFTLLTIGGSTTHCSYLNDDRTWPSLMQDRLRALNPQVWVGNGGLDGHSSRGHVLFMREVVSELRPDLVVVLCGINDVVLWLRSDRHAVDMGAGLAEPFAGFYRSSRLLQFLTLWKRVLFDDTRVRIIDFYLRPVPLDRQEDPVPGDLEELLTALPEYRENLRTIIALGRAYGAETVLMTQPMLMEDDTFWAGLMAPYVEGRPVYSYATRGRFLDAYNRAMLEVCREEGAPCFDLATDLGHDAAWFTDDVHFTEAGCIEVARLVSEYLLTEGLVPPD